MKNRIIPFVIFMIFLVSGFGLRLLWFYTIQKKILEDRYIYKELKEDRGGANSPQEAWNKYLDALEKGNIEEALLYIWPDEREKRKEFLVEKQKRSEPLNPFEKDERILYELPPPYYLEKDEKVFTYLSPQKQKEYFAEIMKDPILKEHYENAKKNPVIYTDAFFLPVKIFKYNPHNKKWYIKQ
ncbi:MAG: hypothetical protein NC816_05635 [Candidatus Omnitrophica bacterium]|nr:hypothetical protein [Candidatus Omnitrophota bacterium]